MSDLFNRPTLFPHHGLHGGFGATTTQDSRRIDAFLMPSVKDRDLTAPPSFPANGDRYIIGTGGGSGLWTGYSAGDFVWWDDFDRVWVRAVPERGWWAVVEDEGVQISHNGTSWTTTGSSDVALFTDLQTAIDSAPTAGIKIKIPAVTFTFSSTIYTPCDRPVEIEGDLAWDTTDGSVRGTTLSFTANTACVALRGNFSSLRNLCIRNTSGGASVAEKSGYGIRIGRRALVDPYPHPGTSSTATEVAKGITGASRNFILDNVVVVDSPGWGVYIPGVGKQSDGVTDEEDASTGSGVNTLSFWVSMTRVYVHSSNAFGGCFIGRGCTTVKLDECKFMHMGRNDDGSASDFDVYYLYAALVTGLKLTGTTTFEGYSPATKAWVNLNSCRGATIENCWFEDDRATTSTGGPLDPTYFIDITGSSTKGFTLRGNHFVRGDGCNGYMRILRAHQSPAIAVSGMVIGMNTGESNGATHTDFAFPSGLYTDTQMFYLDLGTSSVSAWTVVEHPGVYVDNAIGRTFPFTWDGLNGAGLCGYFPEIFRLPGGSGAPGGLGNDVNGSLYMDWQLKGVTGLGGITYHWGGATQTGRRLINSMPLMTTAQRNAGAWIAGDNVWITDAPGPRMELCTVAGSPGTWVAV